MKRPPRDDYYVLMWNWVPPLFGGDRERADTAIQRFFKHSIRTALTSTVSTSMTS